MNIDEGTKKSFDFASDSTKQLLTLSTGILALTITFGKDVYQGVPAASKDLLMQAWIGYLASILFGILTLFALTSTLEPKRKKKAASRGSDASSAGGDSVGGGGGTTAGGGSATAQNGPTIWTGSVRFYSAMQILAFLFATFYVFRVGAASLGSSNVTANTTPNLIQQRISEKHRVLLEALLRKDAAAVETNLSSDGVIMGSLGQVLNRTQVTTDLKSGDLSYESITTDDVTLHVYGETAVKSGHAVVKGKYKAQDIGGEFRYSVVFAKQKDDWQAVSVQVARVKQPVSIGSGRRSRRRGSRTQPRGYSGRNSPRKSGNR